MTETLPTGHSARAQLARDLTAGLPAGWTVRGYPDTPDHLTRPTVMVWTADLEPAPAVGRGRLVTNLDVWVLTPRQDPATADDLLDTHLVEVIGVLHNLPWIDWTRAERGVLADTYHGYRITARAVLKIGD